MDIGGAALTSRQNAFSIASIMSDALADGTCYPYAYGYSGVGGNLSQQGSSPMDYYYNWGQSSPATYNSGLKGMEGRITTDGGSLKVVSHFNRTQQN